MSIETAKRRYPLQELLSQTGQTLHKEKRGEVPNFLKTVDALAKTGIEQGWWTEEEVFDVAPVLSPKPQRIIAGKYIYDKSQGSFVETPFGNVNLSPIEEQILVELLSYPNQIRSSGQLAAAIGKSYERKHDKDLVRVYIGYLRIKLKDKKDKDGNYQLIKYVKFSGYTFCVPEEQATLPQS